MPLPWTSGLPHSKRICLLPGDGLLCASWGSVAGMYSGQREVLPSFSFMGHSERSTPVVPVCLRDAFYQPEKVAFKLWEWHIGQPPKPQEHSGKELVPGSYYQTKEPDSFG